jgi:ABC-type branched-subunit amino acid transport system substrate-binding protein
MQTQRTPFRPGTALIGLLLMGAVLRSAPASDRVPAARLPVYTAWETFTSAQGLPSDSVRSLRVQGSRVWVGTDAGPALYEKGKWRSWTHLGTDEATPFYPISAIDIDARTDDVWLGTWGGGLVRYTAGRFDLFDQKNSGLAGNLIFALVVAGDRVWASTNGGISSFDPVGETWDLYLERRTDTPELTATSLARDPSDAFLYASLWCAGLRRIDLREGEVQTITVSGDLLPRTDQPHDTTSAIAVTPGALWWATQNELRRRCSSRGWEARAIDRQKLPGEFVNCLAARSENEAWLGADGGLLVLADFDADTWITYRACETSPHMLVSVTHEGQACATRLVDSSIPAGRIRCLAFQGDDVWVGSAKGLARGIGSERHLIPASADATEQGIASCPPPKVIGRRPQAAEHQEAPDTVAIAVLSPPSKTVLLPGEGPQPIARLGRVDVSAVQLAVQQGNAAGGYRGRVPFSLSHDRYGYARWGWNMPEDELVALTLGGNVRGMVGYLGPGSTFVTAGLLQTEVPLINAAPTAPTADETVNPWVSRCPGDDPVRHRRLLDYLFRELGFTRLAVLRTPGPAAQTHLNLYTRYARAAGHPPVADLPCDPASADLGSVLDAIRRSDAQAVLTWCDPQPAAAVLRQMRRRKMPQLFVGSEHLVRSDFAALVEEEPGPVIALWSCSLRSDAAQAARFAEQYRSVNGRPPRPGALGSYDAAVHLLQAIELAGLEREDIARTLRDMETAYWAVLREGRWSLPGSASPQMPETP